MCHLCRQGLKHRDFPPFDYSTLIPHLSQIVALANLHQFQYPLIYLSKFKTERHRLFIWVKHANATGNIYHILHLSDALKDLLKLSTTNDDFLVVSEYDRIDKRFVKQLSTHYALPLYETDSEYQKNWLNSKLFRWNQLDTPIVWPPNNHINVSDDKKPKNVFPKIVPHLSYIVQCTREGKFEKAFLFFWSFTSNDSIYLLVMHPHDTQSLDDDDNETFRPIIELREKLSSLTFLSVERLSMFGSNLDDTNSISLLREDNSIVENWLISENFRGRFIQKIRRPYNELVNFRSLDKKI